VSAKQIGWALAQKTGSLEKLVLIVLADRSDANGWSFMAQGTIAERCGCSRKTARTALQTLEEGGFIRRVRRSIGTLRTSDHIQIGPSSRWVKITQPMGSNLPTIPTSPNGVGKEEENSARHGGAKILRFAKP
jgi:hypothetical protein